MILACPNCKASFLVPASLFATGSRTVRCARCGHSWPADPFKKQEKPARDDPSAQSEPPPLFPLPSLPPQPKTIAPPPPRKSLRKILSEFPWGQWIKRFCAAATSLLLLAVFVFLFGHGPLIRTWPDLQKFYDSVGLFPSAPAELLTLRDVQAERRYVDGAMHLIVTGKILSQSAKTQVIPLLSAEAVGPDGQTIQSWHIEPPTATLRPGATVSFSSAILSPEGTVVEVNLSFTESPHDSP